MRYRIALGLGMLLFSLSCGDKRSNHLSNATSPYLEAQAADPVDWYEWGDEALRKAKKEDKPLLVSIGYSACHWCHEMEKESFTDSAVARLMNSEFVCIKVDREERPDIDNMYSDACRLITGSSGWPLNAFALPDGKPFFAGTYYSRSGWIDLLGQIAAAYKYQRNKIDLQAQTLSSGIADPGLSGITNPSIAGTGSSIQQEGRAVYQRLFEDLYHKMDLSNGGLQGTPKFPIPSALEFMLQVHYAAGDRRALNAATNTLTKMALGGIYDQLGGGFARYATDTAWHIPHFEKMLYDNALLLSVYAHAWQLTHNDLFKDIMQGIIGFIERDLGRADGGYYSSLDADTRAGEGEFYAWSTDDLKKSLVPDYPRFAEYYHISEDGNWKDGRNILFSTETPIQFAQIKRIDPGAFTAQLATDKQKLLLQRGKRPGPSVDKKILTSWNALLLNGYLDAYAALGDSMYLHTALKTAIFLEKNMIQQDGRLLHVFREGTSHVDGFLDDYALLANAYLRLYSLTFSKHWLDLARRLADQAIGHFFDAGTGLFFYSGRQEDSAILRKIEIDDSNIPSSNAVMTEVLYKLGHYFENNDYLARSSSMLDRVYDQFSKGGAIYYAKWACVLGLYTHNFDEVAIVGKDDLTMDLGLQKNYLPFCLFMGSSGEENLPLLEGKKQEAQTQIYVCTNKVCKRPVVGIAAALEQLSTIPHR